MDKPDAKSQIVNQVDGEPGEPARPAQVPSSIIPLAELEKALAKAGSDVSQEQKDRWRFNIAVTHFERGRTIESLPFLDAIWENRETLEPVLLLRFALLYLETLTRLRNHAMAEEVGNWLRSPKRFKKLEQTNDKPCFHLPRDFRARDIDFVIDMYLARNRLWQAGDATECLTSVQSSLDAYSSHRDPVAVRNLTWPPPRLQTWSMENFRWSVLASENDVLAGAAARAFDRLSKLKLPNALHKRTAGLNAIGCVQTAMGSPAVALLHFSEALNGIQSGFQLNPSPAMCTLLKKQQLAAYYNTGLALLHSGNFKDAFAALSKCTKSLAESPYLWLRLGECCLQHHCAKLEKAMGHQQNTLLERFIPGSGVRGDLYILPKSRTHYEQEILKEKDDLHLSTAARALTNAIVLCPQSEHSPPRLRRLRSHAVLKLSFCLLCLRRPHDAMRLLTELLHTSNQIDSTIKYFASVYLAEAKCLSGQPQTASQNLNPETFKGSTLEIADSNALLYTNLATVYTLKLQQTPAFDTPNTAAIQKPTQCIQQALSLNIKYNPALRMLLYLRILNGQLDRALQMLNRPTRLRKPRPGT